MLMDTDSGSCHFYRTLVVALIECKVKNHFISGKFYYDLA